MSYQGFPKRPCTEEQDFCAIKKAAAELFRVNRVPQEVERALNELFFHKPGDVYGYLANYFTTLSAPPPISRLNGREIYDSGGKLSVETEVFCIVCNKEKTVRGLFRHAVDSDVKRQLEARSEQRRACPQLPYPASVGLRRFHWTGKFRVRRGLTM
ncbi:Enolase 4 [Larimichthys crocea]|uniref:Enolase 4 n=1 Tax=Larimichthys crocea TaxID=215358 RepID=A0A6G0HLT7_LARCR|nr:Enolase 4 [Larimichthys crocea]